MISAAYAALWIFSFTLAWENVFVIPGLGTIGKLMGLAALGSAALAALFSGRLRHLNAFHVAALLFVAWAGASVFRATYSELAIIKFKTYAQLLAVLWIVWELAPDVRRQRGLMTAYVLGACVASLITIVVRPQANVHMTTRFAAEGFDPNDLGMTLALAIPMAWYLGMTYTQPVLKWACRAYLPVGVVALGLTGSRGAMVASMVALLIVPLTMTRLSIGRKVAAVFLLLAAGGVGVAFIPQSSFQRLGTTRTEVEEGTLNGRLQIWAAGGHAFLEKPMMGWGVGGFEHAIVPWYGRARSPHNSYLGILVEEGTVGFLLWAAMYCTVLLQVVKLPTVERRFALVLLATMAIAMLPLGWDDRKPVWFLPALLVAFAVSIRSSRPGAPAVARAVPVARAPAARQPAPIRARAAPPSRSPWTPRGSSGHDA